MNFFFGFLCGNSTGSKEKKYYHYFGEDTGTHVGKRKREIENTFQ